MSDDSNIRPERLFEVAAAYAQADPEELKIFMAYFHQVLKRTAEKNGKQLGFDMDVFHFRTAHNSSEPARPANHDPF